MKLIKSLYRNKTNIILTAEHASNFIPKEFGNLGLTKKERQGAKDLYDPGAYEVMMRLQNILKTSFIYPNFSRLVIDPNRRLNAKTNKDNTYHSSALKTQLICEIDGQETLINISKNIVANTAEEEKKRWELFVEPYERVIENMTEKVFKIHRQIYLIQIHSFYPVYNGDIRQVDIGVIHDGNNQAQEIIKILRRDTDLVIGDNQPWGMAAVDGGIMKPFMADKNITVIAFDINNKHLRRHRGIRNIAGKLEAVLKSTLH